MRKWLFAVALFALLVAAPVSFAEPGRNGPPGPAGNPNQDAQPAPAAQGPPSTPPGNSGNNPHGGPPGITGEDPQTPASSNAGGNGNNQRSTPATPTAPPASTPPVEAGEPQGPPADVPRGNGGGSENAGGPDGKITICHATGSETNPFVEITISVNGLNGHDDHQDGEDIIPAPAGGCELTTVVTPLETVAAGAFDRSSWPGTDRDFDEPQGGVLDEGEMSGATDELDQEVVGSGVGGSEADGGTGELSDGGQLPFTGLALGGLLLVGALMLASGIGIRHRPRWPFISSE